MDHGLDLDLTSYACAHSWLFRQNNGEWPKHHSNTAGPGSCWDAVSEEQDIGKEVRVPSEGTECRFKVCEWKAVSDKLYLFAVFGEGV